MSSLSLQICWSGTQYALACDTMNIAVSALCLSEVVGLRLRTLLLTNRFSLSWILFAQIALVLLQDSLNANWMSCSRGDNSCIAEDLSQNHDLGCGATSLRLSISFPQLKRGGLRVVPTSRLINTVGRKQIIAASGQNIVCCVGNMLGLSRTLCGEARWFS